jgi:DNA-directed RNA polymerase omega subunit
MSDAPEIVSEADQPGEAAAAGAARPPAAPIRSRFLFVDVAAQRAKQLRRGAVPRVDRLDTHKLERVAMREVHSGCVEWMLPAYKGAPTDATT